MNGRIYDPLLGRMLSADLVVQAPGDLQSYNRYSYVRNNPLTKVDPTGWFDVTLFGFRFTNEGDYSGKRITEAIKKGDWAGVKDALADTGIHRGLEVKANAQTVDKDFQEGGPIYVLVKDFGVGLPPGTGAAGPALRLAGAGEAVVATETVTAAANAIAGTAAVANMAGGDIKPADGAKVSESAPTKEPVKNGEITTMQDAKDRGVVGDKLEAHEPWQHANQKAQGLTERRLDGAASKENPVLMLDKQTHAKVTSAQGKLDAASQTPVQNIESNMKILAEKTATSAEDLKRLEELAKAHAQRFTK